jgi:hypothetical protein
MLLSDTAHSCNQSGALEKLGDESNWEAALGTEYKQANRQSILQVTDEDSGM